MDEGRRKKCEKQEGMLSSPLLVGNDFLQINFHDIKIHGKQERCCKHPGGRAGEAYAQIASLSGSDDGNDASADQLGHSGHHRKQTVSQSLDPISVDIDNGQRNKEGADTF